MTSNDETKKPCAAVRLGALEQQVMDVLWDNEPSTIRQVITLLDSEPAYTTIATVLGNLERKNQVRPRRQGRAVTYEPICTREMHAAQLMGQALSTSGDRTASILHFIDTLDPQDAQALRDYLRASEESG